MAWETMTLSYERLVVDGQWLEPDMANGKVMLFTFSVYIHTGYVGYRFARTKKKQSDTLILIKGQ